MQENITVQPFCSGTYKGMVQKVGSQKNIYGNCMHVMINTRLLHNHSKPWVEKCCIEASPNLKKQHIYLCGITGEKSEQVLSMQTFRAALRNDEERI